VRKSGRERESEYMMEDGPEEVKEVSFGERNGGCDRVSLEVRDALRDGISAKVRMICIRRESV
jgi:hypothetical protein